MDEFQKLKQELPRMRENVPLKNHTTFKIGGPAKYFFIARTAEDVQNAVYAAKKHSIPYFLLSSGSNVLISDKGFNGLVIKVQHTGYKISGTKVQAESGVVMSTLVRETTRRGLAGLEWAGGLPGTVGGAIRGNAGAFGGEIKDSIDQVEVLDETGNKKILSKKQCQFAYRSSFFKEKDFVILGATFELKRGNKKEVQKVAQDHIQYRKERHPLEYPNAGSIFKNCDVKKVPRKVREEFQDVVKQDPFPIIPTAALLAKAQLQGLRVGGAQVSEKHPNYIVNKREASAKDVLQLIKKVKQRIKRKFNVSLEEEMQFIPYVLQKNTFPY